MDELDLVFTPTVNPLLSPPGGLFLSGTFEGGDLGGGGLKERGFNIAKRITSSKNTLVRDRVDLCVVLGTVNSI